MLAVNVSSNYKRLSRLPVVDKLVRAVTTLSRIYFLK